MPLQFTGDTIGIPFIELQSVDSTNKYAMELVQSGFLPDGHTVIKHGATFFAHEQVAGKGQRGKTWASEKGANIAMSFVVNPSGLRIPDQFKLSVCIAVSVHEIFSKYAGDETKIKWPNDIYWRDRKAGGILIENIISNKKPGKWNWAVVGIGININQTKFPPELRNPVSLKQITGKNFQPVIIAKEICSIVNQNFQLLLSGKFDTLFRRYLDHLYKKDEKVKLKKDNRVFEATILGVSETGMLITRHSIEEEFDFGEIEMLLSSSTK